MNAAGLGLISILTFAPVTHTTADATATERTPTESVASSPQDTFTKSNAVAVPTAQQIRSAAAGDQTKNRAIDGMMAHDTKLRRPTAAEDRELRADLGKVDASVLQYAQSRGVKVQVVRPGDDLRDAGVLRPRDPKSIDGQVSQMADFTKKLNADVEKRFDQPLAALDAETAALKKKKGIPENDPFGGLGVFGKAGDKDLEALAARKNELNAEKGKAIGKALDATDLPVTSFHIPGAAGSGGGGMLANVTAIMNTQPTSTDAMATVHGFTTPAEKAQFNKWVEGINGDRLTAARKETIDSFGKTVREHPGDANLSALYAEMQKHPEQIPVDHVKHNIMVPDLYAYREPAPGQKNADPFAPNAKPPAPPKGKATYVDEHDYGTLQGWNTSEGGRIAKPYDPKTYKGTNLLGQFFPKGDVNRLIVANTALNDGTPTHELGHAIDFNIEKEDPGFYKPWKERLSTSYKAAGENPRQQISHYSRTNEREYLAEGFQSYYHDPKTLKTVDPALYTLVKDLTQRASELQAGPRK